MGTIGAVSNPDHMNTTIAKAGRQRWKGRRPHNRGISMNPVDHPHGGRTNGGGHWTTPWGFPTKGKMKVFKSTRAKRSDVKRAIVTLEEGHRIDVTTGL